MDNMPGAMRKRRIIRGKMFFNEDAVRRMLIKVSPELEHEINEITTETLRDYYNNIILESDKQKAFYQIYYIKLMSELN